MGALFGFLGARDDARLSAMGEALAHRGRGPFRSDTGARASLAVRAAHTGHSPWISTGLVADGDLALALAGSVFRTTSGATELAHLLHRYRAVGPAFVTELRGAFVLAIRDRNRLLLARDGVGVRALYWGRHEGGVYFASEPKALLAVPGFPRRIFPPALAQYLTFSFVPGERTMLEDVRELLPGHSLVFDSDTCEAKSLRWFVFEGDSEAARVREEPLSNDWVARFRREHAEAVRCRLPRGEPVGIFLSGGLDSSVVTAEVSAQHDARVLTYAIHFGAHYPNELSYAAAVARRWGTEHHEVLLQPKEFLPRLRRILWHLDDPIGDPITVPNFELAARVAQDVRWVWNGEGGDPVYGGPKNLPMLLHHVYGGIERDAGFRARMYLASYRRSYEEWPRLLAPAWARQIDAERDLEAPVASLFETSPPELFLNKLCAINIRLKAAHLILPKVERMAGASRLVTLSPLFDEELVRSSFQMPARMKLDGGIEKVVMKRAYANELPAPIIGRPKSGMRVPVHFWFQGEMRRYAQSILAPKELKRAGILEPARVKNLLDYDTEEGPGRYGLRLWMLVTFEIWRRIVVEREAV